MWRDKNEAAVIDAPLQQKGNMASFNKVVLVGNLTRDPELRYTPKGAAVAKVSLAINHRWTTDTGEKKEEVTFVEVDCFGRTAENVGQYMKKGRPLLVEGRLRLQQWDDKQTGQKRQKLGVVAESVQFLGGKEEGGGSRPTESNPSEDGQKASEAPQPDAQPESDDVPF
jgi:single-strand DNA-binding protein